MLRFTKIASLIVFFLLIGMGSYARTLVKQTQQKTSSPEENQENEDSSESENQADGPKEEVYQLNLYQAFSLANVQLKWKDFHYEKSAKSFRILPVEKKVAQSQIQKDDTDIFGQLTLALPGAGIGAFVLTETTVERVFTTQPSQGKYHSKTIAYILNCGTYPLSS